MTADDCATYLVPPLPDHIISYILTRLPAQSATRFKTVSKKWNSLISSPNFISSFLSHSPPSWSILDRIIRLDPDLSHTLNLTLSLPPSVSFFSTQQLLPDIIAESGGGSFPCLINSCGGLILFAIIRKRDPHEEHKKNPNYFCWVFEKDNLFVCNPITKQFVYLPDPPQMFQHRGAVGFVTRVVGGPSELGLDFVVSEFQPIIGSENAMLMTFTSLAWKWEVKSAKYELSMHMWRSDGSFQFNGAVYFIDLSFGLIAWDDPFTVEKIVTLKYLSLPYECRRPFNTQDLHKSRRIGAGGGHIQYMEIAKDRMMNLWRFKDHEGGEWSVVCKVKLNDIWNDGSYLESGLRKVVPECEFFHPLEADVVVVKVENSVVVVNVREKKVVDLSSYSNLNGRMFFMPFVVPSWPTWIPPAMIAVSEKDRGNEYFKRNSFNEALSCYSTSIISAPTAIGYANRAAAYFNINRYQEVESDCTEALKLDNNYMKAYARRAIARKELGKLKEAKEDVEHALKLEPEQPDLLKQYAEIKLLLEKATTKEDCSNAAAVF